MNLYQGVVGQPGVSIGSRQDMLFTVAIFCAFFELLILMNFCFNRSC